MRSDDKARPTSQPPKITHRADKENRVAAEKAYKKKSEAKEGQAEREREKRNCIVGLERRPLPAECASKEGGVGATTPTLCAAALSFSAGAGADISG